jgi:hypothetical protein
MRLSALHQVDALERRRNVLRSLRENMDLIARIRTGTALGSITENLSEDLLEQLKPIIDADLARQIVEVEAKMRDLGVEVD